MLTKATTFPIAIDIQEENLYAVQLKGKRHGLGKNRLAIKGLAYKELKTSISEDSEGWENLITELRDIIKNKAFRGKRAVIHLPTEYTHVFPVNLQVNEGDTVEEALLAESGKHFSFPIEEAVIDYPSIVQTSSGPSNTYRSIIVGAQLSKLEQLISEFKKAGLFVEAVDVDVSSLIRVHRYMHDLETDFVALCYIGHAHSVLSVVNQERILVYRHTPWSIQTLIGKLQEHLDLPQSQVIAILRDHGVSQTEVAEGDESAPPSDDAAPMDSVEAAVGEILAPYLEDFVYAFHNVTGYAISEVPDATIQKVYLYGQADIIKGFDRYLESVLNTSVDIVNPIEKVSYGRGLKVSDMPESGSFSLAFGLAMRKVPWL
jgi:type IV pilus assembly protein PilM